MNGRLLNMLQLRRQSRQPAPPQLSRCDMLRPYASAPAAVCLSLILMIVGPVWKSRLRQTHLSWANLRPIRHRANSNG